MFRFKKASRDPAEERAIEGALADVKKQEALIGYVAMMADVEIPQEEELDVQ